ncbi:hypothetical protein C2845_PM11G17730 [Panicum miliaceum]|uniref:Protein DETOXIFICATION n=1 Tax=Panicum miliaceum TaxID=4540 RepID=A0A3L6RUT5_PANMI|nr:hypothetical protein C2845_PM11G17730 [Panicum miliaceum]
MPPAVRSPELQMVSVMFVGHLGKVELAGAAVATSFGGVTGFSLLTGMACSLDTLCGQAFGAGQHHLLGVYKQRAMLVQLVSVPVAAAWAYAGEALARCGQDPEVGAAAGRYIRCLIPALFAFGPLQCHARFLQTQNADVPMMLSSGAAAMAHPSAAAPRWPTASPTRPTCASWRSTSGSRRPARPPGRASPERR